MSRLGREGVTDAIRRVRAGEADALDDLVPLIYEDLRRLAHRQRRSGGSSETLDTTGLVHEAYLKLAAQSRPEWRDRGHFFAVAARAMRHILIDYARGRRRQKRGSGQPHLPLDEMQIAIEAEAAHLVAVDEALTRLAAEDERLARVVECRFFAGLSEEETAEAMGTSVRTVQRDWGQARAWLRKGMAK